MTTNAHAARASCALVFALIAIGCASTNFVHRAAVQRGAAVTAGVGMSAGPPSRANLLAAGQPDPPGPLSAAFLFFSNEASVTYGWNFVDGSGAAIALGVQSAAAALVPFLEAYRELRTTGRPKGLGVRIGALTERQRLAQAFARFDFDTTDNRSASWNSAITIQDGYGNPMLQGTSIGVVNVLGTTWREATGSLYAASLHVAVHRTTGTTRVSAVPPACLGCYSAVRFGPIINVTYGVAFAFTPKF